MFALDLKENDQNEGVHFKLNIKTGLVVGFQQNSQAYEW